MKGKLKMTNTLEIRTAADNGIITESMINCWVKKLMNPIDRFLLRAFFEGMGSKNSKDILNITKEDLDECKDNFLQLKHTHKSKPAYHAIKVSDELIKDAYDAAETYEYIHSKFGMAGEHVCSSPLHDTKVEGTSFRPKYVLKSFPKKLEAQRCTRSPEYIYNELSRISAQLGTNINADDLRTGGMINYINNKCKEMGITAREFLNNKSYKREFCWQYGLSDERFDTDMFLTAYRGYLS